MDRKILISVGPIPVPMGEDLIIPLLAKVGNAIDTIRYFAVRGYPVTVIKWKETDPHLNLSLSVHNVNIVNIETVYEYIEWFWNYAKDYDVFVLGAKIPKLIPLFGDKIKPDRNGKATADFIVPTNIPTCIYKHNPNAIIISENNEKDFYKTAIKTVEDAISSKEALREHVFSLTFSC